MKNYIDTELRSHKHDPENGVYGNCFQVALAGILGLEINEVPHFWGTREAVQGSVETSISIKKWLNSKGYAFIPDYLENDTGMDDRDFIQESLDFISLESLPVILGGINDRGNQHCVVVHKGQVVLDPAGGNGITKTIGGSLYFYTIVAIPEASKRLGFLTPDGLVISDY